MTKGAKLVELIAQSDHLIASEDHRRIMEIATRIESIERSVTHLLQHFAAGSNLSLIEAKTLATILDLDNNARLSIIADHIHMPLSTMTGVATRLERMGLVERKRASDDARASVLLLTAEGTDRLRQMFSPFFEEISSACEQIGPATLESIIESFTAVSQLAESMERRLGLDRES